MMKTAWRNVLLLGFALTTTSALAVDRRGEGAEQAPAYQAVLDCQKVSEHAARLACFDSKVAAIDAATRSGEVVIADKTMIRQSKKALFGFSGLKLAIFGGNDDRDAPSQIEATLTRFSDLGYGRSEFTLDNGSRWRQTDDATIYPRVGSQVIVKRAALGGYMLRIKLNAVRVIRVQ